MASSLDSPDRGDSRALILAAARELVLQKRGEPFTGDEVASLAGLSRRTVFNHFDSMDDIVVSSCLAEIQHAVEQVTPADMSADPSVTDATDVFHHFVRLLARADLAVVSGYIRLAVGDAAVMTPRQTQRLAAAFSRIEADLAEVMTHRYPSAPALDVRLAVMSVIHSLELVAAQWQPADPLDLTDEDLRRWNVLFEYVTNRIAMGYPLRE